MEMIIYTIVKLKLNKSYDAVWLYGILINRKAKEDILSFLPDTKFSSLHLWLFVNIQVGK